MSAIRADYRTTRHIPSRKCYQIIFEVPEEEFPEVCSVLGYPQTGGNTYVGIALLDKSICDSNNRNVTEKITGEPTEGERLRTRAVMLCNDDIFQGYCISFGGSSAVIPTRQDGCATYIRYYCGIESRAEIATNINAQNKFKQLLAEFKAWKLSEQYADNLSR